MKKHQIAVRVDDELLRRLHRRAKKMVPRGAEPLTISSVVRIILSRELAREV